MIEGTVVRVKLEGYRYLVDVTVLQDIDDAVFLAQDPDGNEGFVPKAWIVDTPDALV